ncbi:MAG: helix-turn-helix transcriptional regulator [Clostridiales bacterium]
MPIKFRLKVVLAMNDMTQKQLAEITGIRPPTISAICTNSIKHIPVDVLNKICNALKCQPGDIIEHIPEE